MLQTLPKLTKKLLVTASGDTVFKRGQEYYKNGAVEQLILLRKTLLALVAGEKHYSVKISFDSDNIYEASCTCPYNTEFCKHAIAVLLCCLHTPEKVLPADEFEEALGTLNAAEYKELTLSLILDDPTLFNRVARKIKFNTQPHQQSLTEKPAVTKPAVDPKPYRREAFEILHSTDHMSSSQAYWYEGDIIEQLGTIIGKAIEFLEAGDAQNACIILRALTEVYVAEWINLDGSNGLSGDFFDDLDSAWAETILVADMDDIRASALLHTMEEWYNEVAPDGIDQGFFMSIRALKEGWNTPNITSILAGTCTKPDESPDNTAKELANIRLTLLEKQKRYTEQQHLALYYGLIKQFLHSLLLQNRIEELVKKAQELLASPDDALAIAKELFDVHHTTEALTVASHGLTLEGYKFALGDWLGDAAEKLKQKPLAQKAYIIAFKESQSLKRYKSALKVTVPNSREVLKQELLTILKTKDAGSLDETVKIFLYEQLLDDAMSTIETSSSYFYNDSIKKVMAAVMDYKPTWVIEQAHARALAIINEVKSKNYPYAIEWLTFAKRGYKNMNNLKGWQDCLSSIRIEHKPKRKLMSLLAQAFKELQS